MTTEMIIKTFQTEEEEADDEGKGGSNHFAVNGLGGGKGGR